MNIASGAISEKDEEDFLVNCISLGKGARNEFYESRLTEKNMQLLETIPKTKKIIKKKSEKKEHDLAKETVRFLRHIDYACLRDYTVIYYYTFNLQKDVWSESQISLNW